MARLPNSFLGCSSACTIPFCDHLRFERPMLVKQFAPRALLLLSTLIGLFGPFGARKDSLSRISPIYFQSQAVYACHLQYDVQLISHIALKP